MLTATPQTPVSFLKCFAKRELHGPPDLPREGKGKKRKRLKTWGLCGEPFYTMGHKTRC